MDRTMIDRTMIDSYRAEEKELSEQIHKKLEVLMLIYPSSSEFSSVCCEGMFLKPNQKAFHHVMHFLFTILDANEFRKRFYWPIIDKKSEAIFRTTVVEYLTYLNKKHNLQWKQQWNYLVQMPGGNKFLTFLIELTDFVTNEIIKRQEKYLEENNCKIAEDFSKSLLIKLKKRNKCFKVNALRFAESLEYGTKKYKEYSNIFRSEIDEIADKSKISADKLMDETFVTEFGQFADNLMTEKIFGHEKRISTTGDNLIEIQNACETFVKKESNFQKQKFDVENLMEFTNEFFPHEEIATKKEIDFELLSKIFCKVCPLADDMLSINDENFLSNLNFENEELTKLNADAQKLDNDFKNLFTLVNDEFDALQREQQTSPNDSSDIEQSQLLPKLLFTPPILSNEECQIQFRRRLPLMQSNSSPTREDFSFANNQTTVVYPSFSARKRKDESRYMNKPHNNSKILDPSTFLRSLKKDKKMNQSHRIANKSLTQLAQKWKSQEALLFEEENEISFRMKLTKPTASDKENKIQTDILNLSTAINESLKLYESPLSGRSIEPKLKKKLFLDIPQQFNKIVKGSPSHLIEESELDIKRITTSPSGRLEPLIKINISDLSKQPADLELQLDELEVSSKTNTKIIATESPLLNLSDVKDSLFNVSDSILKDISM